MKASTVVGIIGALCILAALLLDLPLYISGGLVILGGFCGYLVKAFENIEKEGNEEEERENE